MPSSQLQIVESCFFLCSSFCAQSGTVQMIPARCHAQTKAQHQALFTIIDFKFKAKLCDGDAVAD